MLAQISVMWFGPSSEQRDPEETEQAAVKDEMEINLSVKTTKYREK